MFCATLEIDIKCCFLINNLFDIVFMYIDQIIERVLTKSNIFLPDV